MYSMWLWQPSCASGQFECSDGCCISSGYLFDGWCDCPGCDDEDNWTCDDCGGCKDCGDYKYCDSKHGSNYRSDGSGTDGDDSGSRSRSSSNNGNDDGMDTTTIILIVAATCAVVLIVIGVVMWKRRNNSGQKKQVSLLNKSDPEYIPPENDATTKNDPQIDGPKMMLKFIKKKIILKFKCVNLQLSWYCSKELTPTQVFAQPTLTWASEKDALYTVVLIDPDALSGKDH